jgi:hypothetical protein
MSPDLNPIEHIWDMLGRRIHAREPPVQNKGQNSLNIIGNSTPHFPLFSLILHVYGNSDKDKWERVKRSNFKYIEIQPVIQKIAGFLK